VSVLTASSLSLSATSGLLVYELNMSDKSGSFATQAEDPHEASGGNPLYLEALAGISVSEVVDELPLRELACRCR
jgi:hypothetical protein